MLRHLRLNHTEGSDPYIPLTEEEKDTLRRVVRIADNTPDEFLLAACRVARQVSGKLKFLGDNTTIANLELDGIPTEVARNYAIAGCTSPVVGGQVYNIPGGILSLPGILELALNDGVHRLTGLQLGAKTGDCAHFATYDDLWNAFCAQVRHIIPHCHNIKTPTRRPSPGWPPPPSSRPPGGPY